MPHHDIDHDDDGTTDHDDDYTRHEHIDQHHDSPDDHLVHDFDHPADDYHHEHHDIHDEHGPYDHDDHQHDDHSPFDHDHHVVNHDDDSAAPDHDNQPDHDLNHGNATADHHVVHLSPVNHGAKHRPNHDDYRTMHECPLYPPER